MQSLRQWSLLKIWLNLKPTLNLKILLEMKMVYCLVVHVQIRISNPVSWENITIWLFHMNLSYSIDKEHFDLQKKVSKHLTRTATNSLKLKIVTNCHETVLKYPDLVRATKHLGCLYFQPSISEVFSVLLLQRLSMPKTSMRGARLYIWPGYLMVSHVIVWNPSPRCPLPHESPEAWFVVLGGQDLLLK